MTQAAAGLHMPAGWDGQLAGGYGLINMAYRGNMVQEVHCDGGSQPLDPTATFDDLPGPRATGWAVGIPLVAQTAESGATEYWAGSHRDLGLKAGQRPAPCRAVRAENFVHVDSRPVS